MIGYISDIKEKGKIKRKLTNAITVVILLEATIGKYIRVFKNDIYIYNT